jgi:STAS domain
MADPQYGVSVSEAQLEAVTEAMVGLHERERFPLATPLTLTIEESGSTRLLRIAGELDMATAGQVTAALDRLDLDAATLVIFDLQGLDFLDLAGQARLTVIEPRGFASRVFTLTRAHRDST